MESGGKFAAAFYDGGVLHARKRAAQFELTASLAVYRATVLNAFGEVADALQAAQNDQTAIIRAEDADRTATQAYTEDLPNRHGGG